MNIHRTAAALLLAALAGCESAPSAKAPPAMSQTQTASASAMAQSQSGSQKQSQSQTISQSQSQGSTQATHSNTSDSHMQALLDLAKADGVNVSAFQNSTQSSNNVTIVLMNITAAAPSVKLWNFLHNVETSTLGLTIRSVDIAPLKEGADNLIASISIASRTGAPVGKPAMVACCRDITALFPRDLPVVATAISLRDQSTTGNRLIRAVLTYKTSSADAPKTIITRAGANPRFVNLRFASTASDTHQLTFDFSPDKPAATATAPAKGAH